MAYGYNGKILRINLSSGEVKTETQDESFYRKYFGGRNLIAHYLLNELEPGIDPLGEENKLIFATGVLTGAAFPGSGRHSIGAKSPLTGGYGDGEAGGYWGAELKRAGVDALIFEGKADKPVYVVIRDGEVEIKEAGHLWGKTTAEAQSLIEEEEGKVRVALVGPAGENLVKYACVVHDLSHFVGRSGMGAVMGSKNLKAVAVAGTGKVPVADKDKLQEYNRFMAKNFRELAGPLHELGTLRVLPPLNAAGGLPTNNFQYGHMDGAGEKLSGEELRENYGTGIEGCYACPINCGTKVKLDGEYGINPDYKGPEYETVGALGSNLGIDDWEIILKANELCSAYGLDTISTGVTISFAMECFERGLISEDETSGYNLEFGSSDVIEIIKDIAFRKGLGEVLAEGSKKAAEIWGNDTLKYAVQVKGQEVPMHEPRLKQGLGIGYAISPTGADHTHNMHDTMYEQDGSALEDLRSLGYDQPLPALETSPRKARLLKYGSFPRYLADCMVTCFFLPWTIVQLEGIIRAVTGWNTTTVEMEAVSERSINQTRLFNLREGFTAEDDNLSPRFFEKFTAGPLEGINIDPDKLAEAVLTYYDMMGWDQNGVPTRANLLELGLETEDV